MSIGACRSRISKCASARCCASSIMARARRKKQRCSAGRARSRRSAARSCRWSEAGSSGSAASPRITSSPITRTPTCACAAGTRARRPGCTSSTSGIWRARARRRCCRTTKAPRLSTAGCSPANGMTGLPRHCSAAWRRRHPPISARPHKRDGPESDNKNMSDKKTVLLVSLFHPELVRGGAQEICYELFEGLRDDPDYRPVLLASIDATYPALFKSGARITGFDGRADEFLFLSRDYDHWWHRTSDPLLVETYTEFLEQIRPDIVHFHHFLTYGVELISLTRRVLPQARLVMTFHEFLAICNANGHMVRPFDHSLCRTASQVRCHQCFPERSPEDFFVRKLWLQSHFGAIDAFTCPSRFMLDHYADWGIARDKLFHVTNGQRDYAAAGNGPAPHGTKARDDARDRFNRFGFFGQIVDAKGVQIIQRAVDLLRAEGFTDFAVEINGGNMNYASPEVRSEIET